MNNFPNQPELGFIVSQPRSGSTLLQRMLCVHPQVHTTSEPWLMLPPAYTLRNEGLKAEYDADLANQAIHAFWENLPGGRDDYIEGIRHMYGFLYRKVLHETEADLFLDKTPRYYLILPELQEIFPQARFLLLLRNPLAVLSSILRTWVGDHWLKLANFRIDLLEAPRLILESQSILNESGVVVRYEDLVCEPAAELQDLCEHLDLEFDAGMIEYGDTNTEKWNYGDSESVYKHRQPHSSSLGKWEQPENAQEWRLLREYADWLGSDIFNAMGFDLGQCVKKLEAVRPPANKLRYTVSLSWILDTGSDNWTRRHWHGVKLLNAIREDGWSSAVHYAVDRVQAQF